MDVSFYKIDVFISVFTKTVANKLFQIDKSFVRKKLVL